MGKASKALVSVSVLPLVACLMMSGAAASEGQSRPSEPISGDAAETSEQTSVDQQPAGSDAEIVVTGTIRRSLEAAAEIKRDSVQVVRSEEHTSELQSLMRISHSGFRMQKKRLNK